MKKFEAVKIAVIAMKKENHNGPAKKGWFEIDKAFERVLKVIDAIEESDTKNE